MSLFKILRGDSERISTNITPFHDGYAYFTSDEGGFYIDAEENNVQKRIRINPKAACIPITLASGGWLNGRQTVNVEGVTVASNGVVGLSPNATEEQTEAAKDAEMRVVSQTAGSITIEAFGHVP